MVSFTPVASIKKTTRIVEQIINAIEAGECAFGSRLPSERALASATSTSRVCVREALSILQCYGVVETRPNSGTYVVRRATGEENIRKAHGALEASEDLLQIWGARKHLETNLLASSIGRIDRFDLGNCREALSSMRESAHRHAVVEYLAADKLFHLSIARLSKNEPLTNAIRALLVVSTNQLLSNVSRDYVRLSLEESLSKHTAVFDAVERNDVEAAIRAMTFHFEHLEQYFSRNITGQMLAAKCE